MKPDSAHRKPPRVGLNLLLRGAQSTEYGTRAGCLAEYSWGSSSSKQAHNSVYSGWRMDTTDTKIAPVSPPIQGVPPPPNTFSSKGSRHTGLNPGQIEKNVGGGKIYPPSFHPPRVISFSTNSPQMGRAISVFSTVFFVGSAWIAGPFPLWGEESISPSCCPPSPFSWMLSCTYNRSRICYFVRNIVCVPLFTCEWTSTFGIPPGEDFPWPQR